MEIKVIVFIYLLAYTFIVSQSLSYIISLHNVQKNLTALSYVEFRKLTDKNFRAKFKFVFYATLIIGPIVIWATVKDGVGLLAVTTIISYVAFWVDAIIMLKGNMPINNLINTWSKENYPDNWVSYRDKWLYVFRLRQIANITGFIALLGGIVFA